MLASLCVEAQASEKPQVTSYRAFQNSGRTAFFMPAKGFVVDIEWKDRPFEVKLDENNTGYGSQVCETIYVGSPWRWKLRFSSILCLDPTWYAL